MGDGVAVWVTAGLLLLSPAFGVAALLGMRRSSVATLRQLLLANLFFTAAVGTFLFAMSVQTERRAEEEWTGFMQQVPVVSFPGATANAKPWWKITLSVAIDRLNRGPLCWLAWGALAAGLMTSGKPPESAARYAWLLGLEAAWLWMYAAGDGVVFTAACLLAGLCMAMLTALWGREERRTAAARLWRWWLVADGLLLLGLLGLTTAAAWSQQHVTPTVPSLSMSWNTLAQVLPRTAMHNQSAAQYWTTSAGWWLFALIAAAAIRSGLPPFHSATVSWWGQVSAPVGVMTVMGSLPWGLFVWMRVIAPTFAIELREQSAVLAGWGPLATLGAGMLCLAQTDARRFAAYFSLAGLGLAWFTLSSGQPGTAAGAWDVAVTFALGSAALFALICAMDERQSNRQHTGWAELATSAPRWSAALLLTIGGFIGFPAAMRGRTDWLLGWSLAGARPGPFFIAALGWFIASWAAVWMLQRWLWGTAPRLNRDVERGFVDSSSSRVVLEAVEDLRIMETTAILILLILAGLVSSGVMSTTWDLPRDETGVSVQETSSGAHQTGRADRGADILGGIAS